MLTATLAAAMALLPAAVAGAHDGAAGEAVHHHRHHHGHHVHFVTFLAHERHTANTPATPTPTPPTTVASFTDGVLTLKLADGSTVSGKVNEFTRIRSEDANDDVDDDDFGDEHHGDRGSGSWGHGDDMGGGPGPSSGGGHDNDNDENHNCNNEQMNGSTSLLVPGAQIGEAELRIGSTGAFWAFLEVLPSS